jgi:RNA polymerase sigma-70 factor (ECF subfamily)
VWYDEALGLRSKRPFCAQIQARDNNWPKFEESLRFLAVRSVISTDSGTIRPPGTVKGANPLRSTAIEKPTPPPTHCNADQAFGDAIDEYSQRGLRYANSVLRSLADAEEVVQEAFCRLLMSRHRADPYDDVSAIFFTTIRNLCVDVIRRRRRRPTMSIADVATEPCAGDTGELAELQRVVRDAIDELPQNWADALRLRVDGDLRYDEISMILRCSKSQVRTWIYRARRQLEQELVKQELVTNNLPSRPQR